MFPGFGSVFSICSVLDSCKHKSSFGTKFWKPAEINHHASFRIFEEKQIFGEIIAGWDDAAVRGFRKRIPLNGPSSGNS